jgi:hypothetical protein
MFVRVWVSQAVLAVAVLVNFVALVVGGGSVYNRILQSVSLVIGPLFIAKLELLNRRLRYQRRGLPYFLANKFMLLVMPIVEGSDDWMEGLMSDVFRMASASTSTNTKDFVFHARRVAITLAPLVRRHRDPALSTAEALVHLWSIWTAGDLTEELRSSLVAVGTGVDAEEADDIE